MVAKARIDDVAALAKVAIKTVSRVLNNEPNVRPDTREKVLHAVKTLNYHPNLSARSLASRRSYLVGLVYDNPSANYTIEVQSGRWRVPRGRQVPAVPACLKSGRSEELMQDILSSPTTHLDGVVLRRR